MENILRNRAFRVLSALGLAALVVWSFLPYLFNRISSQAIVNAELVRYASPISGRIAGSVPRPGAVIEQPIAMTLVENFALDRRHIGGLQQQVSVAEAQVQQLERQLIELTFENKSLARREVKHGAAVIQRLNAELREAEAEVLARAAEEDERRRHRERMEKLGKTGFASQMRVDEIRGSHESSYARMLAAQARVERARADLAAARQGIYIQDSYNDAPYSKQQRDRLLIRRQDFESELMRERTRIERLRAEIDQEERRLVEVARFDAKLPAAHVVWSVTASPGTPIIEGQPIIELADCTNRFVVVELPERHFEEIKPGDQVAVRLIGSDEYSNGRIRQIRGSAARQDERLLAARIPAPAPRHISVEVGIEMPPREGAHSFCDIGRLAEVRFLRGGFGPFNWIAQALARDY